MRFVCVLALGLLLCLQLSGQSNSRVAGEYVEARSGEVYTCGCLFSSEQVTAGKEAILAWHIREGEYRGTALAGVKAAAVIVGKGNLGLTATNRTSVLYVNQGSTSDQQEAVVDLLSHNYGQVLGEIISVHTAPVSFDKNNGETYVRIDNIAAVVIRSVRLPEDAHPGSFLWYGPFIPMKAPMLATTLYYRFWGPDFRRQWWTAEPGITAYTGDFVLAR
ncbi:MAG TPA: DUF1326 domain-containing protein [Alphaproteobacteria bacterium]|nr:DUF1326 domain-containing protein [Alphaproteobacteria bacterium]